MHTWWNLTGKTDGWTDIGNEARPFTQYLGSSDRSKLYAYVTNVNESNILKLFLLLMLSDFHIRKKTKGDWLYGQPNKIPIEFN